MKTALVTGGFGFLGSHLGELLLQAGYAVHVVDDLSTSPIDVEDYLGQLGRPRELTFDVCTVAAYMSRADLPAYDEVYHLASPVGPAGVLRHAGNMIRDIVRDSYSLMDYCRKIGAKLLDVSTSEVYGGGQEGYCPESTPKIVPAKTTVRLEYAIGKLAAETAITNTCRVTDLQATIVRPFNISGPRQSPRGGFVLPRFIQQAHTGAPLTVFGKGGALRAFTHVRDMANGIHLAMRHGKSGEAYNMGNPANKTTILGLAQCVIQLLESKSSITFVDPKTIYGDLYEEASDKFPDAQKAMRELTWRPQFDVAHIVADAYQEFLRQEKAGVLREYVSA